MKRLILLLVIAGLAWPGYAEQGKRPLTASEVRAVIQAAEDEIYDHGHYGEFYQMGDNLGTPQHWKSRMHIYVNPDYDATESVGQVVYKFMPYGEVFRVFFLQKDGQVVLDGDPHNRFPLTQPSHQTIYMDDEEVCRIKQNWLKGFFVVDVSPTPVMIQEAARRQKGRTGFSAWEDRHSNSNK